MGRGRILALVGGAFALTFAAPLAAENAGPPMDRFELDMLAAHNDERMRVGVPRLAWSGELANDARAWAQHLVRTRTFEHSTWEQRRHEGENMLMGPAGIGSGYDLIGRFIAERQYYRPNRFPDVSTTGNWVDVGHYTQLVWRETREVGCAAADDGYREVLVCRYFPAGNYADHLAY